jgi:putative copper export protein
MQTFLGLLHGVDYLITHLLIGTLLFNLVIVGAGGASALELRSNWKKGILSLIFFNFFTSSLWMFFSVHDMTESWDFSNLWLGMSDTSFAHVWCLKLLFLLFISFLVQIEQGKKWTQHLLILSIFVLPFAFVYTSHASANENHKSMSMVIDWAHSLAVGVWTGGLWALFHWLGKRLESHNFSDPNSSYLVVIRFSHFAMASTFIIAVSGLAMAWLNGIELLRPWATDYGSMLVGKTVFFSMALAAAAINQFLHIRKWNPENEIQFSKSLRREISLEMVFVFVVFVIAGFLTRTSLPNG